MNESADVSGLVGFQGQLSGQGDGLRCFRLDGHDVVCLRIEMHSKISHERDSHDVQLSFVADPEVVVPGLAPEGDRPSVDRFHLQSIVPGPSHRSGRSGDSGLQMLEVCFECVPGEAADHGSGVEKEFQLGSIDVEFDTRSGVFREIPC